MNLDHPLTSTTHRCLEVIQSRRICNLHLLEVGSFIDLAEMLRSIPCSSIAQG